MIINNYNSNKIINFIPNKLPKNELNNINIPSFVINLNKLNFLDYIIKIDDNYYYYKAINQSEMINELIGSYLSKEIGLEAVDYKIGIYNNELYALSELFYEQDYMYDNCFSYYNTYSDNELSLFERIISKIYLNNHKVLDKISNKNMLDNILKLISIDLKMGQLDRHNMNLTLKISKENSELNLAPVYDFSKSYENQFYFYNNPFIILRLNKFSLSSFYSKYPHIEKYINILKNIKIDDILSQIELDNDITISDSKRISYIEKDKFYNKILKKIL